MVLTEMTVAVTRARVRRAEAGSYEGWKAQRTAAVELGLRARLGGGKNVKWQFSQPPPLFI